MVAMRDELDGMNVTARDGAGGVPVPADAAGDSAPGRALAPGALLAAAGYGALVDDLPRDLLRPATGSDDPCLSMALITDLGRMMGLGRPVRAGGGEDGEDGEDAAEAEAAARAAEVAQAWTIETTLATMRAAAPRDGLEGMLAAQMAAAHRAAMDITGRATAPGLPPAARAALMAQAGRMMHLFARQLETLDRRRGQAPAVTVGNVNVESGGNAFVGNYVPRPPEE